MKLTRLWAWVGVVSLLGGLCLDAQDASPQTTQISGGEAASTASSAAGTVVPRLAQYSGVIRDAAGKPATGVVAATFSLYELQEGGTPLWGETQNLQLDGQGRYTVLLGATQPEGLPLDLFTTGRAQWLGVQPQLPGTGEQPRVLLVGMPYALKAADADTLGGKPASAYVLSDGQIAASATSATESTASASGGPISGAQKAGLQTASENGSPLATVAGAGTKNFIPIWLNGTTLGNSVLFQSGSNVGVGTMSPGAKLDVPVGAGVAVRGTSSDPNGVGVSGNDTALTGSANGVSGTSASTSGSGVAGNAIATSGYTNGVYGSVVSSNGIGIAGYNNASFGGTGVRGVATATSGSPTGVYGQINGTSGAGVSGVATGTSGYNNGVYGQTASTSGAGVNGNAIATSGTTSGVAGQTASPDGIGVYGVAEASTGGIGAAGTIGVRGDAYATTGNAWGLFGTTGTTGTGAGVFGSAYASAGNGEGVGGETDSPGGIGVRGYASAASGSPVGVVGFVESPGAVAGQFVAHGGSGLILQGLSGSNFAQVFTVDASGNLDISGNLTVAGSKSARVEMQDGREVALYAVESPENWFEDFGTAQLQGGAAAIRLEPGFLQTVDTAAGYHVFLTPNGDCRGLYVASKTPAGFEVRELGGGNASIAFDYRIVAHRRGFENVRLQEVHPPQGPKDMQARLAAMRSAKAMVLPPPPKITNPVMPHPAAQAH